MRPLHTRIRVRLLLLAWLLTWVTTVPLFHLHLPDTTDGWSTLHSGGAHTIFTPDLPGEYSPPIHDNHPGRAGHLLQRVVNSPELGFALFDDDRKVKPLSILGAPSCVCEAPLLFSVGFTFLGTYRRRHRFKALPASRAPPHMVADCRVSGESGSLSPRYPHGTSCQLLFLIHPPKAFAELQKLRMTRGACSSSMALCAPSVRATLTLSGVCARSDARGRVLEGGDLKSFEGTGDVSYSARCHEVSRVPFTLTQTYCYGTIQ